MTSTLFTELLKALGFLSVLLLLGTFLRAKIKFFQTTFLPASVIGGFIGLLLGPIVFNVLPIPEDWINMYALLPGVLIVPIVASVPLGMKMNSGTNNNGGFKKILPIFFIMSIVGAIQLIVGFGTQLLFKSTNEMYQTFGWELSLGFAGGHGTAGLLGQILNSMGLTYWKTAQGVAVTTATFGIVGGILIGILLINIASRRGWTEVIKKPGEIPEEFKHGYQADITKQNSLGRETTISTSIDTIAFHFAIIILGCFISYLLLDFLKTYSIPILSNISVWAYAILIMFSINYFINKLKIDYLVESKVKSKIAGSLTDFAVVSAIASLPIKAVATFIVPILVMVIIGLLATLLVVPISKKLLNKYWFEYSMAMLGMNTGVFLTGLMLLRICDPDLETPVLANFSLSYAFASAIGFALFQLYISVMMNYGAFGMVILALGLLALYSILAIVSSKMVFNKSAKEAA